MPAVQETWVPALGRSPGEGNGNPLQYSCLENLMDRGAWQAKVHGFAKSRTQQKRLTLIFHCVCVSLTHIHLLYLFIC